MCVASTSVVLSVLLDAHASRARPAAPALHFLHFVLAEQKLDALGVLVDDHFLARQRRRPVQREILHVDAKFLGTLQRVVNFGGVQQNFGGNAADVQASAAQITVFFNDQRFSVPIARRESRCYIPRDRCR